MYRVLLRTFPREFRSAFGAEMTALFAERRRDARRAGIAAYIAFWIRTLIDVTQHGIAERRAVARKKGDSPMRSFFQDVRFAVRLFGQRPGFTATAVLTIALGIGVNIAIFSVLNGVLIRWLPFPNVNQIVYVTETHGDAKRQPFNPRNFIDVQRDTVDVFQALAAYRTMPGTLNGFGEAAKIVVTATSPKLFDVMSVAPAAGRPLTAGDVEAEARSIVVSERFWRARLGSDSRVIGLPVEIDGEMWTIVGVMPKDVAFPETTDVWKPLTFTPQELMGRNSWYLQAAGRLRAGITLAAANASLARAMASVPLGPNDSHGRSAEAIDLREDTVSPIRSDLLFAQGVAALILLIACVNLANLLLASATVRRHELSIRAAIGAGGRRLIRQLLTEGLVLSAAGSALGMVIAYLLVPAIVAAYPGQLPGRERITVSLTELLVAIGAAGVTTILFGLAPALMGSRVEPASGLKSSPGIGPSRVVRLWRSSLVTIEVVLTLSLLAGAVLLIKSFMTMTSQPIGFDAANVLTASVQLPTARFPTDEQRRAFFARVLDRIGSEPDVVNTAVTNPLPFDLHGIGAMFRWDPSAGSPQPLFGNLRFVSTDYLDVLRVPLVRGRFFGAGDTPTSAQVAVVSEAFAQKYGNGGDVVGMRFQSEANAPWITIVGVVADVRFSFLQKPQPQIMFPLAQSGPSTMTLAVRTRTSPDKFAARLREIVRTADPALPLTGLAPLSTVIGDSVSQRRFNMSLLVTLAALAVLLSTVGVYGVMAYVVGQRTREMGVRLALGARPSQLQSLVIRQGLVPIGIGIAGGLGGAWFLTTLLKKDLFQVKPHDPATLAIAAASFFVVGVLACWLPSRRAARIDPVQVLRID